ncbi:MAG TPA: lysylphosphatidylglycerol synthase transmembrane domain-containing protein [Bryobacteraceae bacterium]|nr:lysylphosphatidylglycerol synthase transmembrane domain-containing protein [Bryobacteraceae bacterium]
MPSWAPQAAGYVLSAVCLIWVLRGYPIKEELIPALRELDWKWIAIAIGFDVSVYFVQAWRWNTLLEPVIRLGFWRTSQAIFVGLFANEVLPLRTGELIRCYLLAHWNNLRISLSFASAAVERLIDGVVLVACFMFTAGIVRGVPEDLTILVRILGIGLILLSVALMWLIRRKLDTHPVFKESRWAATFRHVVEGLHLMGNRRTLVVTSSISILYVVLQFFSMWAVMKAYQLDLSLWAAASVVSIIRLWTVVPNAPGNLGFLNAACVVALRGLDVEPKVATTFSIILFGVWTLPIVALGAIATALTGSNITELRRRARMGAQG